MSILILSSDVYLSPLQADLKGGSGTASLDLELLKQYRVSAVATNSIEARSVGPSMARVQLFHCSKPPHSG